MRVSNCHVDSQRIGMLALIGLASCAGRAMREEVVSVEPPDPQRVLRMLGARGAAGYSADEISQFHRVFGFNDADGDGKLTRQEYVEDGRYMTPRARAGIFRAMDRDRDDLVTEREYVENRIITDEARKVFDRLDTDGDRVLTEHEFTGPSGIEDERAAREAFRAFDGDGDGAVGLIELLRIWGDVARKGTGWAIVQ